MFALLAFASKVWVKIGKPSLPCSSWLNSMLITEYIHNAYPPPHHATSSLKGQGLPCAQLSIPGTLQSTWHNAVMYVSVCVCVCFSIYKNVVKIPTSWWELNEIIYVMWLSQSLEDKVFNKWQFKKVKICKLLWDPGKRVRPGFGSWWQNQGATSQIQKLSVVPRLVWPRKPREENSEEYRNSRYEEKNLTWGWDANILDSIKSNNDQIWTLSLHGACPVARCVPQPDFRNTNIMEMEENVYTLSLSSLHNPTTFFFRRWDSSFLCQL